MEAARADALRESFTALYLRSCGSFTRRVAKSVGHREDAQDVVQQAFSQAWQALPGYRGAVEGLESWVVRIIDNCAADHARRRGRTFATDPVMLQEMQDAADALMPPDLRWGSTEDVHMLLMRLPTAQREVLALTYVGRFTLREIAHALGRSPDSIRQIHHRALRFLEARLRDTREPRLGVDHSETDAERRERRLGGAGADSEARRGGMRSSGVR